MKKTATHIILYTDFQVIVDGSVEEAGTEEKTKKRKRSVLKYKLKPPASKKGRVLYMTKSLWKNWTNFITQFHLF